MIKKSIEDAKENKIGVTVDKSNAYIESTSKITPFSKDSIMQKRLDGNNNKSKEEETMNDTKENVNNSFALGTLLGKIIIKKPKSMLILLFSFIICLGILFNFGFALALITFGSSGIIIGICNVFGAYLKSLES